MKQLIARYDAEWKDRLGAIARMVIGGRQRAGIRLRPHRPQDPPAGAAVRAAERRRQLRRAHRRHCGKPGARRRSTRRTRRRRRRRARRGGAGDSGSDRARHLGARAGDTRDNPYLFQKSPTVLIGNNDSIVVPRGRTNIDFECEFTAVIGKRAKYVPIANAADYIFGYTAHHDVSDRGGRGDRKMGGSDWLIQKNHDTFGPLGPFIVPKEFIKDPMNTRHTMTLNSEVMQDSNTSRMSHNIYELVSYASNIMTLNAGDDIAGGSPAGTNIERAEPRWMRAGDTAKCSIEGHRRPDQPRRGGIERVDQLAESGPAKRRPRMDGLLAYPRRFRFLV